MTEKTTQGRPDPDMLRERQQLGMLIQGGNFRQAKELCTSLCHRFPDDAEMWFTLGAINGQLGCFAEAETCCINALEISPDYAPLYFNLGIARFKLGRLEGAATAFQKAIQLSPGYAEALHELGNVRQSQERLDDALQLYRQSIEYQSDNAAVFHNLATACRSLGRMDEAASAWETAIELKPDFITAYTDLAAMLANKHHFEKAIDVLTRATAVVPGEPGILHQLGMAYLDQGEVESAKACYQQCLAIEPENFGALAGMAAVLILQGKYGEARDLSVRLLSERPGDPLAAYTYSALPESYQQAFCARDLIENQLDNSALPDSTRSKLLFALGKMHDSSGAYNEAFAVYQEANRLRHSVFNRAETQRLFLALKDTCTQAGMARMSRSSVIGSSPVFIVGMPRSGTSLVEQIISSHSAVFGAGELPKIQSLIASLAESPGEHQPYPWRMKDITGDHLTELSGQYLDEAIARSGMAKRVVDKMPVNFLHLGFISMLFSDAKIIHCVRDPVDTCLSCYFMNFSGEYGYAYDLGDLGFYYKLYADLMTHWKKTLDIPILDVRYEELVSNQELVSRRILEFCGLDWEEKCLRYYETERTVATASYDQVRRPVYTKSIGRSNHYARFIGELVSSLA